MIYSNKEVNFETSPFFREPKYDKPIVEEQCIFIDIETVPAYSSYKEMPVNLQKRWSEKVDKWIKYSDNSKSKILDAVFTEFENNEGTVFDQNLLFEIYKKNQKSTASEQYLNISSLYPEYAKTLCITISFFKDGEMQFVTFIGDEYELLSNFQFGIQKVHERLFKKFSEIWVVGHNISFFDIPFLSKRMSINGLRVPSFLHQAFQQPWNKKIIDTAIEWRVGNTTGDATLETLCEVLNISNPKMSEINGENLAKYYYSKEFDINKVVEYCEADVKAQYLLFNHLQNLKKAI